MSTHRVADLLPQFLEELQERADHPFTDPGPLTGLKDLDRVLQGFRAGELTIVGGRPAMGKTSLVANIAVHVACSQGLPVLLFSELSPQDMLARLMATHGGINLRRLRSGALSDGEWPEVSRCIEELRNAPISIQALADLTDVVLLSEAERIHEEHGPLGLILIDCLKLDTGTGEGSAALHPTQFLKKLAMKIQVPMVATAPLLSSIESRFEKRPFLSDLPLADVIERDADVILFLFREQYYKGGSDHELGAAEVRVARNRSGGPTASVKLAFRHGIARFENMGADLLSGHTE